MYAQCTYLLLYVLMYIRTYIWILGLPYIDEGSIIPRPSVITRGNKRVKIGTPVYVYSGFDVTIDCNIVNGTPPITIQWFRNGSPDPTRGNVSTITITAASNGDVFTCRADNIKGFDSENTCLYIEYGKYICNICVLISCGNFKLVCFFEVCKFCEFPPMWFDLWNWSPKIIIRPKS